MSRIGLRAKTLRTSIAFVAAGLLAVAGTARASVITNVVTDGFGDGDRDNNGTTEVAPTDPLDVGAPWYYAGSGTSSSVLQSVDDSAGIGNGNALQFSNSPGKNNRITAAHFNTVALNDGDSIVFRFDMRLVSTDTTVDRNFRFGLYNASGNDYSPGDKGSTDTTYLNDVGYMGRVDGGPDASNSTTMDIVRDDSNAATVIGGTSTSLSPAVQSTGPNQLVDANKHHFEMTLTRNGTGYNLSLQEDGNAALTGADASPGVVGFNFNSVAFATRTAAITDYRFDNIGVDYIAAPEPAAFTLLTLGAAAGSLRRKRRSL